MQSRASNSSSGKGYSLINPNVIKTLKKEYILPPPMPSPSHSPVFPLAKEKITNRFASCCGLNIVPPQLAKLAEEGHNQLCPVNMSRINVGMATCGQAAGADKRFELLAKRPDFQNKVIVRGVGCLGACFEEPLIDIRTPDGLHHIYCKADSDTHWSVIHTAQNGTVQSGAKLILREKEPGILTGYGDLEYDSSYNSTLGNFLQPQKRRVTENFGLIDPFSLSEYTATGGYFALAKALFKLLPEQVIAIITASGLRGRGGAGFKTGLKWETAAASNDRERILIANADEGDPSAYMDRTLMESDPHRILEGILLASYAIGAHQAYIFIRKEYPLSVKTLRQAITDDEEAGLLGKNILNSGFSLNIDIIQSAGAFVCGEETAMLEVMEGRRGEPRLRPPYPAMQGYFGHPTVINNVETLANVPWIITYGADAFREAGNTESPGTKMFCLTGDIPNRGCIEVPLGISSKAVVENIGGASPDAVKAIQIGGPAGGIVPYKDFAIDFSSITAIGAMIDSVGLVVLNQQRCLVDLSRHLVSFMADESCGRCLFCRDGLALLNSILQKLTAKEGTPEMLNELKKLCRMVSDISACGLGRSAVNPLSTSLHYFWKEFESHLDGVCPAASCKSMICFEIELSKCKACVGCVMKYCPVGAIKENSATSGPERYHIDNELCLRCWTCAQVCPYNCIKAVSDSKLDQRKEY